MTGRLDGKEQTHKNGRDTTALGLAVAGFIQYGQKSVGFLASLFQGDDVNWYGSGKIAILS